MKNRNLNLVIILGIFSLIALILIQFYWMQNVLYQKKQIFNLNVHEAMEEAIALYDKVYTAQQLKDVSEQKKKLEKYFLEEMKRKNNPVLVKDQYITNYVLQQTKIGGMEFDIEHNSKIENNLDFPETEIWIDDSTSIISISSIPDIVLPNVVKKVDTKVITVEKIIENKPVSDVKPKYDMVREMIDELVYLSFYETAHDSQYYIFLDSILNNVLERKGIKVNYDFGFAVFDNQNNATFVKGSNLNKIRESKYKTWLTNNRVFEAPKFLKVYIPNENKYLTGKMSAALGISFLIISAIIFFFIYAVRNLIKERRLTVIKNDFINNMTHELKTPLTTINLACETALEQPKTMGKDEKGLFGIVKNESIRLSKVVDLVLKNSLIDKPDFELQIKEEKLQETVKEIIAEMKILADEKNARINIDIQNGMKTNIDKFHFKMVLKNMIDNALKYNISDPEVNIRAEEDRHHINVHIQDNGIGISKEHQGKVFDKFYRVPTGNVHNVKGFGLGLNYAKQVIEKHGGVLKLKSEQGQGSEFVINLPKDNTDEL